MKFPLILREGLRRTSFILPTSRHPDPSLQAFWNCAEISLFLFPLWPAVGAVGLALVALGTWKQQMKAIVWRPLNWGLAILSGWLLITACFAFQPPDAMLGLANLLPYFIIFAGYSTLIQTPDQLRQMAWILIMPSVVVVIIGFGQLFWGWSSSVNFLGWAIEPQGNPIGRMASVFMYANILAAYLQVVFILALGLWIESFQSLRDRAHTDSASLRLGFLSVVVMGSAIALILTNSRNAWTITILSCLAFAIYQGWRWLLAVVAAVAGSVLWAAFGPSPVREWLRGIVPAYFWARLTDQLYTDRPPEMLRVTQWQFAWSMTQQRPWMGWGLRNFTALYKEQMHVWLGHPHNLFLMLTAETGIPATVLFCGLVGWVLAQGVLVVGNCSKDRLILFSYLLAFGGCILFNTVDVTLFDLRVNTLGWLLLSAICGVVYKKKAISRTPN
jgi:O-antigen ligase